MRSLLTILAVWTVLCACAPKAMQAPSDPQLDAWLAELHDASDVQTAARLEKYVWERWSRAESPTVSVLLERAERAQAAGQDALALAFLEQACDLEPSLAAPWYQRASLAFKQNDNAAALLAIHETLVREPRHFGALAGLGLIYEGFGRPEAALAAYEAALAEHPFFEPAKQGVQRLRGKTAGRST